MDLRNPRSGGLYLALGDSLAVGIGASRPAEMGYVARLHTALARPDATPRVAALRNLSISGETSRSMIDYGQLEEAVRTIRHADPPVALVTLDIGGNDLLALLRTDACQIDPLGPSCLGLLARTLDEYEDNLRHIVGRLTDALRAHAPGAPLAIMTYYNPFSGADPRFDDAAELGLLGDDRRMNCDAPPGDARGMNDVIACVARELGAVLVDVHPPFVGRGLELTNIGMYDVHANDRGFAVMADRFVDVLARSRARA